MSIQAITGNVMGGQEKEVGEEEGEDGVRETEGASGELPHLTQSI